MDVLCQFEIVFSKDTFNLLSCALRQGECLIALFTFSDTSNFW